MNERDFQELVRRRPDLAKFFQFVEGSRRQRGYYRRIPKTWKDMGARSKPQLKAQLALTQSAMSLYDKKLQGFVDGVPVVAFHNANALRGKRFKAPVWQQAIRELAEALKEAYEVVAET